MISYPADAAGGLPAGTAHRGAWTDQLSMPRQQDYEALARFRYEVRSFLAFSGDFLEANGVPPVQYQAMLAIRAGGDNEVTVGDLAAELHITIQSGVELVARMQAAQLITRERSARDRRRVLLRLTPQAETMLARMAAFHLAEMGKRAPAFAAAVATFLAAARHP